MIIMENYTGTAPNQTLIFADGGLPDLMAWLKATEHKSQFRSGGPRDSDRGDFNGYATWDEALTMARDGWHEGAMRIERGMPTPAFFPRESKRPHWAMDIAGSLPDVGRYLAGDPRHMSRRKVDKGRKPVITLYIGMGIRAEVSEKQFTNFGTSVCQLVDTLEHHGTRVELNQLTRASMRYGYCVTGWRIKEASQPLDMSAVAFTYMHLSAHRRIQFQMRARYFSGTGGSTDVHFVDFPGAPQSALIFAGVSEAGAQCRTLSDARRWLQKRINIAAKEELVTDDMLVHLED